MAPTSDERREVHGDVRAVPSEIRRETARRDEEEAQDESD